MDIEDFVKDVLGQVTRAVNNNTSGGKTRYFVDSSNGVSFDLAVVTAYKDSKATELSGGLKVKVIGAEGSKAKTSESNTEQSSRVQFKVHVYTEADESQVVSTGGGGFFHPDDRY